VQTPRAGLRAPVDCAGGAAILAVMDTLSDAAARAAARASWPGLKTTLAEAPGDDLSAPTTAEQRVARVAALTASGAPLAAHGGALISRGMRTVVLPVRARGR